MLLARLHRRSIRTVQMLSTLRREWKDIKGDAQDDPVNQFRQVPSTRCRYFPAGVSNSTRIVCMSDTHGKHNDILYLPKGDVLIHAGDLTQYGETDVIQCLSRYFETQSEVFGFQQVI